MYASACTELLGVCQLVSPFLSALHTLCVSDGRRPSTAFVLLAVGWFCRRKRPPLPHNCSTGLVLSSQAELSGSALATPPERCMKGYCDCRRPLPLPGFPNRVEHPPSSHKRDAYGRRDGGYGKQCGIGRCCSRRRAS